MTAALLDDLLVLPTPRVLPERAGLVARARAAISGAKPWQAVLVDWSNGAPMVLGDATSRHWTRWGARRAADWANLRVLPVGLVGGLLRYMALPTRHPATS